MSTREVLAGGKIRSGTKNARRYEFECVATELISAGDIVVVTDVTGEFWKIAKADADTTALGGGVLLLAKHRITSGKRGRCAVMGVITSDMTGAAVDTSTGYVGMPIFLSSAAGAYSGFSVGIGRVIGRVLKVSATDGQILFNGLAEAPSTRATQALASTAITGTTETLTTFSTGVYTIPANRLRVNTRVRIRAVGRVTAATGAETHVLAVTFAGTAIMLTGDIDPAANDVFMIDAEFTVRAIGATGTIVGAGVVRSGPQAAAATTHLIATGTGATSTSTIDTTAASVLGIALDRQAAATDGDSMRLDAFNVEIIG